MEDYRIFSVLQPRQVKWVTQDQAQWLITLDSGFIDNIPEYNFRDWDTGSNLLASGSELDGWMDGWINGLREGGMEEWMDGWRNGGREGYRDGRTN